MAKFCWMPLYTSDLVSSCVDMTPHQFGAYVRLLCYAWDNSGLPNDFDACARIAGGIEGQDWKVIRRRLDVIDAGTDQERLSHPRLEAEREKQANLHDSRSEAGRRAAEKRWQTHSKRNADALTKPCHLEPEPEPELDINTELEDLPHAAHGDAPSVPQKRNRSKPADPLRWDSDSGWQGIADTDRTAWAKAYPAVSVDVEMARADQWLRAHPEKAHRSKWRQFLVGWFSRTQDRGGTRGGTPNSAMPTAETKRYFRSEFQQSMTDAEFAKAMSNRRKAPGAVTLANGIKLKEEHL